jgi:phospholipid/cholesterol/gamma-HCH transport system permease protein
VIADFFGVFGGYLVGCLIFNLTTPTHYWNSAWRSLEYNDLAQGLLKPLCFGIILSLVGCFYGIRTTGGTQGVGLATTKAVVVASVWIFVVNSVITRLFVSL